MSSSTTSSSTRSPYIGSVISLISKSAVRYAGILSNVNLQEETIALEQVRCFGSEGRKGNPAEELPSSNTIYEYVVFRAADITNLKVCEPPKPLSTVPNDPAIAYVTRPPPPPPAPSSDLPSATSNASMSFSTFSRAEMPPPPKSQDRYPHPGFSGTILNPTTTPTTTPAAAAAAANLNNNGYTFPGSNNLLWSNQPPPIQDLDSGSVVQNNINPALELRFGDIPASSASIAAVTASKVVNTSESPKDGLASNASKKVEASNASSTPPIHSTSTNTNERDSHRRPSQVAVETVAKEEKPISATPSYFKSDSNNVNKPVNNLENKTLPTPNGTRGKSGGGGSASTVTGGGGNGPPRRKRETHQPGKEHNNSHQNGSDPANFNRRKPRRHHNGGRGKPLGEKPPAKDGQSKMVDEFDFETSNAKFDKQELLKELAKVSLNDVVEVKQDLPKAVKEAPVVAAFDKCYNPSRSFFDDISCESKERGIPNVEGGKPTSSERRARLHQERRVNLETFGQTSVDSPLRSSGPNRHHRHKPASGRVNNSTKPNHTYHGKGSGGGGGGGGEKKQHTTGGGGGDNNKVKVK